MSEAKPTRRLSSLLKSKRTERVVELVVVPILLIVSLLLPPASVGTRLLNLDLPSLQPDKATEIIGPAGARLNVPEGAVAKRVKVRFDSVGAAELGAMSSDSLEMIAAQQVPMDLLAFEPFYRFEVKGDGPSQAKLTLPVPYELAALDLADLYAWDGAAWKWVPSQISADGLDLVADLEGLDTLYLIAQTQPQTPRVGFVATPEQAADVPPSAAVVSLQGATLAGDGTIANLPQPAGDIADADVLLQVSNLVDGVRRSDWLDNLIIDPALVQQHVAALSGQTGFDGIELDYQGADPALGAEFTTLVRALGDALHAQGKTLAIVLDPPVAGTTDTGAYDWRALGQVADLVRIRAYTEPAAYAVDGAMDDLIKLATNQIDRHKIDLALSADCLVMDGDQALPISYQQALTMLASELNVDDSDGLLLPGESITVKLAGLQDAEVSFDPEAQVYSFRLATSAGGEQTVLLTNAASIARRTQYVNRYALGGTSIEGALAPEADSAIATLLDDLPHTVVPPTPRFAYVYTIWNADGDAIGSQVVTVDDASMTWTAPNNPGRYIIQAEVSDDGGETTLGTVGSVDVSVPTPTFTPTPTNTPTPTPTNTPAPTNTPQPTAVPQAQPAAAAVGAGGGSVGGYFGYGIQAHMLDIGDLGTVIGHINGMGFNWVKQQVEWWRFNPAPGQYNWGSLDQVVDAASSNGINVLLSVVAAPEWARPGGDDRSVAGPPADPATYATFMRELASRYKGRVKAYEIWNEQNLWYEWGGRGNRLSATAYVELLRHAYNAVKSVDPGAVVISGAMTPTGLNDGNYAIDDRTYLEQMYQAGFARYCDAVGAHPSGYNMPPDADWTSYSDPGAAFRGPYDNRHPSWSFRGTMESYRNIMVKYGDGGKRIWPTEFGWATTEGLGVGANPNYEYAADNSEAEQAAYLVRAFQMGRNWGWVGPMFVWNLNFGPVSGVQDEKAKFGIVRPDWSPRPAYAALRDMGK